MRMTRREFNALSAGTLLSSLASVEKISAATTAPSDSSTALPWYRTIKRVGQTNFNEHDGDSQNVEQWADYWASAKVQAVALSVSGPVAFYPSKIPYFHHSIYLKGRDLFGECVRAAKKRGLYVYGRMSPDIQWTDPKLLETNPLWFRRTENGGLQQPAPDIAYTCIFSDHYAKQQPAIIRELNENYDIDGVYMNGWPTMQVCYCENCRKIGLPHSQQYHQALMDKAVELIQLYKTTVLEKSPNNFYSCNLGGGLKESGLDQWLLTREASWYTADNQSRSSVVAPVWQDAQQVKFARALMGDRSVAAVSASYGRSGRVAWRQATDTSAEPSFRMAQTAAAGGIIWYHWLGLKQGFEDDRRWQAPGRDFLSWHAKNDKHFHNKRSLASVAVVVSPRSVNLYKAPYTEDRVDHLEGTYAALVEARIPFDYVHEQDLNQERISPYAVLILPNMALMSDAQAETIRQYAERGGSVLATFQTGLFDETGAPRKDFILGELFGINKAGEPTRANEEFHQSMGGIHLQYIRQRSSLTHGFEETTWIAGPEWRQPIVPHRDAVMTFIKPYPVYPPEAVYQREPPSDIPAMVSRENGSSRLVYMAGDVDSSFWRLDSMDLGRQMTNALRWLLKERNAVDVEGDGLMEVIPWETQQGFAVHLLNYNGANAFRGHMRRPVALATQNVRVKLPSERKVRRARLLSADTTVSFQQIGNHVSLTVPKVEIYEVVALEI